VFTRVKPACTFAVLICIALGSGPNRALAVTAEVARKCKALTTKAYPPRQIGNPAAGSAKGTGRAEQDYFNSCVVNAGKTDDPAPNQSK